MSRRSRRRCARSIRTACAEARPGAAGANRRGRPGACRAPRAARYCKPRVPCLPAARSMPASQFLMQRSALAGVQAVAARSDRTFARHSHEQFGIGVIRHGAQASHSGRGQVQAQAGQVITVNPGEIHDGAPLGDAGRAWQMLYLDPRSPPKRPRVPACRRIRISAACVRRPRPGPGCAGALCASHRQCRSAGLRRAAAARAGARGGGRRAAAAPSAPSAIRHARARIDDDPAASLSLADLAAACGLSRYQTLRAFARDTGMTPHAYQVQRRLLLARG